jgi:hypothetical protein
MGCHIVKTRATVCVCVCALGNFMSGVEPLALLIFGRDPFLFFFPFPSGWSRYAGTRSE